MLAEARFISRKKTKLLILTNVLLILTLHTLHRFGITNLSRSHQFNQNLKIHEAYYSMQRTDRVTEVPQQKLILFWNRWRLDGFGNLKEGNKSFQMCHEAGKTCEITYDKSRLNESDAVVVAMRILPLRPIPLFPAYRPPRQRWVFYLMESPIRTDMNTKGKNVNLSRFNGIFNWTMTYRLDSDIPRPYAKVIDISTTLEQTVINYAKGKTKLVAWFVSNCNTDYTGRIKYARELQQYISIDIYGECGNLTCAKDDTSCNNMLTRDYKFYLAFENSYCHDYVTEKTYLRLMSNNVIPVVRGGANYTKLTPPHSVINTADFNSPKQLADYLSYLNENDLAYSEYFAWKQNYRILRWPNLSLCDLCEKLHNPSEPVKVYYDIQDWWVKQGNCVEA